LLRNIQIASGQRRSLAYPCYCNCISF
jgi:hypothetical protein